MHRWALRGKPGGSLVAIYLHLGNVVPNDPVLILCDFGLLIPMVDFLFCSPACYTHPSLRPPLRFSSPHSKLADVACPIGLLSTAMPDSTSKYHTPNQKKIYVTLWQSIWEHKCQHIVYGGNHVMILCQIHARMFFRMYVSRHMSAYVRRHIGIYVRVCVSIRIRMHVGIVVGINVWMYVKTCCQKTC